MASPNEDVVVVVRGGRPSEPGVPTPYKKGALEFGRLTTGVLCEVCEESLYSGERAWDADLTMVEYSELGTAFGPDTSSMPSLVRGGARSWLHIAGLRALDAFRDGIH
mmetsp:Transcript_40845/g.76435  ORF Transcript_40845/g.76435 Transcript_40845/m.76435 type:complete len:108 (+) Transcript_40845:890-1213(+)|eukprot:CAMPEP_0114279072 /NCGR_PEP_ID=MMETSP0059-20121206/1678_1 /TAXON_ID=36894 /ORGANISM="Pyramimonas parkeae, Strain CCMP726" /LENGTH=107 /DNA_ID=CAMNT_0001399319 /DNA_START=872 /DNA_END=1195 /DNA_ORIENTATION=+